MRHLVGRGSLIGLMLLGILLWTGLPLSAADADDAQVAVWVKLLSGYGAPQPETAAERESELQAARNGIAALKPPERAIHIVRRLLSGASWMGHVEGARIANQMRAGAVAILPDLLESLHDRNALTREAATRALAAVVGDSPARPRVIERLGQLLDDDTVTVRGAALEGLSDLAALEGVLPVQHLLDPDWRFRTLPPLFDAGSTAHDSLGRLLGHDSWHVRVALLRSLSQWLRKNKGGRSFDPWRPLLAGRVADDPSGAVRAAALQVVGQAARNHLPVAELLLPALSDEDLSVRIQAYELVIGHRLAARKAIADRMLIALSSENSGEQAAAAWALRAAPPDRADVSTALWVLVDAPPPIGDSAVASLLERGDTRPPLLERLVIYIQSGGVPWPYLAREGGRRFFGTKPSGFRVFQARPTWNQKRLVAFGAVMTPLLQARLAVADDATRIRWIHALSYTGPTGLAALRKLSPQLPEAAQQVIVLTRIHSGDRDPALVAPAMKMLEAAPVVEHAERWEDRDQAEDALLLLGTVAVPALVQGIRSHYDGADGIVPDFVTACRALLKKIGAAARPQLEEAAKDEKLGWFFKEILRDLGK